MNKIQYATKIQTNEDFSKQAELVIKYLKRMNGKTVDLNSIRNLAIKCSALKALLPYRNIDPELKMRLERTFKAVRKIEKALHDYGSITLNIEESDLKGLGIAKQEPIKQAPPESKPEPAPVETDKVPNDCVAREIPIKDIFTDEERFQNRKTAFSEISAQAVAENFDPNKFDPITVWFDPVARKLFVLSGHSRLEGMKRRKAKTIPAKMFIGTEAEAIQFARVDANRSAKEETLTEDLEAYRLMKKGDEKKGIEPATPKEIKASFKNKTDMLDDLSYLAKDGKFITALNAENKSEYPFIERFARWTGQLRKEIKLTNADEDQIFNFLYSGAVKLHTLDYDSFKKLVKERKDSGAEKLFDCEGFQCNEVQELEEFLGDNKKAEIVRKIQTLEENRALTYNLLNTDNPYLKTYTQEEKQYKRMLIEQTDAEIAKLKAEIGMKVKKEPALFGISETFPKTVSGKELVRILQRNNWEVVRQKGSHIMVENPSGGTVSVPNHKELATGTYRSIQKKVNNLGRL